MPENIDRFKFKVGDRVTTIASDNYCGVGEIGTVISRIDFKDAEGEDTFSPSYVLLMEESGTRWIPCPDFYVDGKFNADMEETPRYIRENNIHISSHSFWIPQERILKKLPSNWKAKTVTCDVCNTVLRPNRMVKSAKGKYVCKECLRKKSYSTKNDIMAGKSTKQGWTFGFEFECIPKSEANEAVLVSKRWGFVPTSDGSLPSNGVELKSPIIQGRSSLRRMFNDAYNNVDFANAHCGQHINIGNSLWINEHNMRCIRENKARLFNRLGQYMDRHPEDVRRLCGRGFGCYRSYDTAYRHGSWLNLEHNNRFEWRISKFVTPDQYFNLCNMWCDMMTCVNKHYLKSTCDSRAADTTGALLVEIFKKYAASPIPTAESKKKS